MNNVTPKVDIAFKKIFGVEENKDLLISLVNSIVGDEDQVSDLTLLNPYNPKNFQTDKLSILDIKAKGRDGKRFNIEIQITDEGDYDKRALYYWAKLYTEQLENAGEYSSLSKAIGIHILNFTSIGNTDKYHNCFQVIEKETGEKFFTDLELHTIELKKFESGTKELNQLVSKIKSSLDMWLAFLTKHNLLNKDKLPKVLDDKNLKKALTELEVMNFTKEERNAYEDHLKWLRIEANTIKHAEEKALKKGVKQGINQEKIEIAKKMLSKKYNISDISSVTGLSEKEIKKLQ